MRNLIYFFITVLVSSPIFAIDFSIPENAITVFEETGEGNITFPRGRYTLDQQPSEAVSGKFTRQAWQIPGTENSPSIFDAMKREYERMGFEIVYECFAESCGGFDFRFGIQTAPGPDFKINPSDFEYADLEKDGEHISILISPLGGRVYVQQEHVSKNEPSIVAMTVATPSTELSDDANATAQSKNSNGRTILQSVKFGVGSAELSAFDDAELVEIAEALKVNPNLTAYIVGHSDQTGSLATNLNLSKRRAQSVRAKLINEFGIPQSRIIAEGVAFLAPIADNNTEIGRSKNRRVEVVYLTN